MSDVEEMIDRFGFALVDHLIVCTWNEESYRTVSYGFSVRGVSCFLLLLLLLPLLPLLLPFLLRNLYERDYVHCYYSCGQAQKENPALPTISPGQNTKPASQPTRHPWVNPTYHYHQILTNNPIQCNATSNNCVCISICIIRISSIPFIALPPASDLLLHSIHLQPVSCSFSSSIQIDCLTHTRHLAPHQRNCPLRTTNQCPLTETPNPAACQVSLHQPARLSGQAYLT
ncbi:hypothetical protein VTL71DRAFT_12376 [Oculimacula yallundae]|uniref:Uncharacterized protein n=1 Tax=Oculimacula yallundae TaxID=86028 RepID=A0ABR4CME2_9HELO